MAQQSKAAAQQLSAAVAGATRCTLPYDSPSSMGGELKSFDTWEAAQAEGVQNLTVPFAVRNLKELEDALVSEASVILKVKLDVFKGLARRGVGRTGCATAPQPHSVFPADKSD